MPYKPDYPFIAMNTFKISYLQKVCWFRKFNRGDKIMPEIFQYTDYRKFLHDWYQEKKKHNPVFSCRMVAQKVGYRSPGYLSMVLGSKIGMSLSMGMKFASFMKLKKREADYFQYMILFGEAKSHDEKLAYFEKMRAFKESAIYTVNNSQYEYYSKWYHSAIRALLEFFDFKTEYSQIAKLLVPEISPQEAKASIELLKTLKMIVADSKGFLRPAEALVTTGYDAEGFLLSNFIVNSLRQSENALYRFPRKERNFSCLTLGISEAGFQQVQQELREFRRKIMQIAAKDNAQRIYHLGFQLFPLSHNYSREARKK